MRVYGAVALAVLMLLLQSGCAEIPLQTAHTRGWPSRVHVEKTASEPRTVIHAERRGGKVRIKARARTDVSLKRTAAYSVWEVRLLGDNGPITEGLEMLFGIVALAVVGPAMLSSSASLPPQSPEVKVENRPSAGAVFVDPRTDAFATKWVSRVVDTDKFAPQVVRRQYSAELPMVDVQLTWTLLDANQKDLAQGSGVTDDYGKVELPEPGPEAVAVRVIAGGAEVVVPILGALPPAAVPANAVPARTPSDSSSP